MLPKSIPSVSKKKRVKSCYTRQQKYGGQRELIRKVLIDNTHKWMTLTEIWNAAQELYVPEEGQCEILCYNSVNAQLRDLCNIGEVSKFDKTEEVPNQYLHGGQRVLARKVLQDNDNEWLSIDEIVTAAKALHHQEPDEWDEVKVDGLRKQLRYLAVKSKELHRKKTLNGGVMVDHYMFNESCACID